MQITESRILFILLKYLSYTFFRTYFSPLQATLFHLKLVLSNNQALVWEQSVNVPAEVPTKYCDRHKMNAVNKTGHKIENSCSFQWYTMLLHKGRYVDTFRRAKPTVT